MKDEYERIKDSWNEKADDWHIQVGDEGDRNRRQNSDPFLWEFLGNNIENKQILDAGCGTGYLCRKLTQKNAIVTGVDISDKMIEIAKNLANRSSLPGTYLVDSISNLSELQTNYFDIIISNYVLQDTPEIEPVLQSFHRVLKASGRVIIVITHPCFPQSDFTKLREDGTVHYKWEHSYLDNRRIVDEPWGHFKSKFIFYHRSLSHYWKMFKKCGFIVMGFDEPAPKDLSAVDNDEKKFLENRMRLNSVIFELKKWDYRRT